jgi:hypothetical protein
VDQGQFSDSDLISGRENVQFDDIQNIIENQWSLESMRTITNCKSESQMGGCFSIVLEKWKEIKREYFHVCMNQGSLLMHEITRELNT